MEKRFITLIELLVVICVIMILTAMLLPALKKARQNTYTIVCRGNLKQLGSANAMYIQDNDSWLPWSTTNNKLWDVLFMPSLGYSQAITDANSKSGYSVFHCPLGKAPSGFSAYPFRSKGYFYNYNLTACENSGIPHGVKTTNTSTPSLLMLILDGKHPTEEHAEGWTFSGKTNPGFFDYQGYLKNISYDRHNNRSNILFCDGHSEKGTCGLYYSDKDGWRFQEDYTPIP